MRLRGIASCMLAAAALGLAACGSGDTDEKNEYVDAVNEVNEQLRADTDKALNRAGALSSPNSVGDLYDTFSRQLETAASDIEAIEPPDDVADLNAQLAKQIRGLSGDAKQASADIAEGGAAEATGVASAFIAEANAQSVEIDATISEINQVLQG